MRKKRNGKKFLAVFGALLALSAALPVQAALAGKTIEVFTGVTIYVDGVEMKPTDANGKEVGLRERPKLQGHRRLLSLTPGR